MIDERLPQSGLQDSAPQGGSTPEALPSLRLQSPPEPLPQQQQHRQQEEPNGLAEHQYSPASSSQPRHAEQLASQLSAVAVSVPLPSSLQAMPPLTMGLSLLQSQAEEAQQPPLPLINDNFTSRSSSIANSGSYSNSDSNSRSSRDGTSLMPRTLFEASSDELSFAPMALERSSPTDTSETHLEAQPSSGDDVTMQPAAVASASCEQESEHAIAAPEEAALEQAAAGTSKHQNMFKGFLGDHQNRALWPKQRAQSRAYHSHTHSPPAYQRRSRDWGASPAREGVAKTPGLLQWREGGWGGNPFETRLNGVPLPAPPATVAAQQLRQLSATTHPPGDGSPTLSPAYNEPSSVRRDSEAASSDSSRRSGRASLDSRLPSPPSDSNAGGAAPQPPLLEHLLVHLPLKPHTHYSTSG